MGIGDFCSGKWLKVLGLRWYGLVESVRTCLGDPNLDDEIGQFSESGFGGLRVIEGLEDSFGRTYH